MWASKMARESPSLVEVSTVWEAPLEKKAEENENAVWLFPLVEYFLLGAEGFKLHKYLHKISAFSV